MINAVLALVAVSGPVPEPIDFRLGWKKGDKLTYTLGMGGGDTEFVLSGDVVFSVLSENEKGFTVGSSRFQYKGPTKIRIQPGHAGTITFSYKGHVTEMTGQRGREFSAGKHFVHAVLPSKPVSVGDKFLVSVNYNNTRAELEGTFVSLDGAERTLAKFEFTGQLTDPGGNKFPLTVKSVFDTRRKIFVSIYENLNEGMINRSFKLKEPPKVGRARSN